MTDIIEWANKTHKEIEMIQKQLTKKEKDSLEQLWSEYSK